MLQIHFLSYTLTTLITISNSSKWNTPFNILRLYSAKYVIFIVFPNNPQKSAWLYKKIILWRHMTEDLYTTNEIINCLRRTLPRFSMKASEARVEVTKGPIWLVHNLPLKLNRVKTSDRDPFILRKWILIHISWDLILYLFC